MASTQLPLRMLSPGVLLLAAACSSTGDLPSLPSSPSYSDLYSSGDTLMSTIETLGPTPEVNMPVSGTATYVGVAGLSSAAPFSSYDDAELIGQAVLTADLSKHELSGSMTGFRDMSNDAFSGTIVIDNGQITGNGFNGDVSGSLTSPGASGGTVALSGTTSGNFMGTDAEGLLGTMSGTRTGSASGAFYGLIGAGKAP